MEWMIFVVMNLLAFGFLILNGIFRKRNYFSLISMVIFLFLGVMLWATGLYLPI